MRTCSEEKDSKSRAVFSRGSIDARTCPKPLRPVLYRPGSKKGTFRVYTIKIPELRPFFEQRHHIVRLFFPTATQCHRISTITGEHQPQIRTHLVIDDRNALGMLSRDAVFGAPQASVAKGVLLCLSASRWTGIAKKYSIAVLYSR